jgi:hypothetical protein
LQKVDRRPSYVLIGLAARRKKQIAEPDWGVFRRLGWSDARLRLGNEELVPRVEIAIANTRDADIDLIRLAGAITLK